MTRSIEGNFWCCAGKARPFDILYHSPVTGRQLLMAGSMFYGSSSPILTGSKASAKLYADEWNASMDNEPSLLVAPRRIRIKIDVDDGQKEERK